MRKILFFLLLLSGSAWAQGSFWKLPQPLPNAKVLVCPIQTANPCPSPSSIFSDSALSLAVANPFNVGPTGNFGFWAASGQYTIYIGQPYNISFDITLGGGSGGPITTSITPENFGAVGNGVTNDCAAFTTGSASNTDLWLTSGHNYFIAGTCTVSANIHYNNNSQFIVGPGATLNHNGTPFAGVQQIFTEQATTSVADTMQRANENPMSDGGQWVVGSWSGFAGITAEAGQLVSNAYEGVTNSASSIGYVLWSNGGSFGANQKSSITVKTVASASGVVCAVVRGSTSNSNHYRLCSAAALGATEFWTIGKIVGATSTVLATCNTSFGSGTSGPTFSGDVVTLAVSGTTLTAYMNNAPMTLNSAQTPCTTTDGAIASGLPGMEVFTGGTGIANFQLSGWSGQTLDQGAVNFGAAIGTNQPEWFGAKGDGTTDDTVAIQNAINSFAVNGGRVTFNPKVNANVYKTTQTLVVQNNGIWLVGVPTVSIEIFSPTANGVLFLGVSGTNLNNNLMQDINVVRSSAPQSGDANYGVAINFVNLFTYERVQSYNSFSGFAQSNSSGPINYLHTVAATNAGIMTNGYLFLGVNNSTRVIDSYVLSLGGGIVNGMQMTGPGAISDLFVDGFETAGTMTASVLVTGGTGLENVKFIRPIFDGTFTGFDIESQTGGSFGADNNMQITDCFCNASVNGIKINASTGITVTGGYFNGFGGGSAIGILLTGGATKNIINGPHLYPNNLATTNTFIGVSVVGSTNNIISNVLVNAGTGHIFNTGVSLTSTSTGNTISGLSCTGFGTTCLSLDATSTNNAISELATDTTNITTPISDAGSGNIYVASKLIAGVIGNAVSYKSTSAITGPVPVKWDTGNANQVVQTITTDTAAGVPMGVCVNSPGAGAGCLVMINGTGPLRLGTGTCAIGQFAIVDTTTNGDIKCSTYTAGTVIGTAQAANSTVGTTSNFLIGLR